LQSGQNPRHNSSIKNTHHLQIAKGSLADYPVYQRVNEPRNVAMPSAETELVFDWIPLGQKEDACFYKFEASLPVADEVIECMINLYRELAKQFGGGHQIDFLMHCVAQENGRCLIFFSPIAQCDLEPEGPQSTRYRIINRVTGKNLIFSQKGGLGAFSGGNLAIKNYIGISLGEFYDFLCLDGMREAVSKILQVSPSRRARFI